MAALEPADPDRIGRYRLLRRLGEGGMGLVYLGVSPAGRAVAIKVVRPDLAGNQEFRARFRAEAEAARKVSGAFTASVVDADPDGPVPWLATAYVNGPNLKEAVDRYGPMPEHLLRTLGAGLGEALIAIHQAGLLHRDLKPGNILLAKDGPRVIDFGISKATDGTTLTVEGRVLGSPGYMSPEQIRGGRLTTAADVFAFGAVLAFAATGRPPYGRDAVPTILHRTLHEPPDLRGVPESLVRMAAACLSPDPGQRPPAHLLPSLLAAQPAGPGWLPAPLGEELRQREDTLILDLRAIARARTRRRLLTGGAVAAGIALVGGGTSTALALARGRQGRRPAPPKLLWRAAVEDQDAGPTILPRTIICSGDNGLTYRGYSLATGAHLWSTEFADATYGPTLIYAVSGATLTAMDGSRAVTWTYHLPATFQSSPYLVGPVGGVLAVTDQKTTTLGVDAATGRLRWTYHWPQGTSVAYLYGTQGNILLTGGLTGTNFQVVALDIATGTVEWAQRTASGSQATPPAGDGNLVFANPAGTTLNALSMNTGRQIWSANLPNAAAYPDQPRELSADVTTADNMVYIAGPDVYALDAATGRQRWIYTSASSSRQERTFLLNGHIAYVLDNPRLVALDSRTGRRLWAVTTPAASAAPLIAAGGLICMGVADVAGAGLYGWDATSGRLVWNHPTTSTDPTDAWQLDARGSTLAAAHNNALYAFRLNSP